MGTPDVVIGRGVDFRAAPVALRRSRSLPVNGKVHDLVWNGWGVGGGGIKKVRPGQLLDVMHNVVIERQNTETRDNDEVPTRPTVRLTHISGHPDSSNGVSLQTNLG